MRQQFVTFSASVTELLETYFDVHWKIIAARLTASGNYETETMSCQQYISVAPTNFL